MSEKIKKKAEELTDAAIEQVTGGFEIEMTTFVRCPACQHSYSYNGSGRSKPPSCPKCGYEWKTNQTGIATAL